MDGFLVFSSIGLLLFLVIIGKRLAHRGKKRTADEAPRGDRGYAEGCASGCLIGSLMGEDSGDDSCLGGCLGLVSALAIMASVWFL